MKKISLVVSAYNEEQGLAEFARVAGSVMQAFCAPEGQDAVYGYELFFVNDGSSDRTGDVLAELRREDPEHVKVLTFSRNFGHEAAMCAGLDHADGDYLIFLDADLQHPPVLVPEIMKAFENGAEVINMVRTKNRTAGAVKNLTSGMYYALMNKISTVHMEPNASDFFAMDRKAAEVLRKNYRDKLRFLRGFLQNIGFRKAVLEYEAAPRVAGSSHYSLKKLFRLFISTVVSFSEVPLRLSVYAGILSFAASLALLIAGLIAGKGVMSGEMVILTVLCFLFSVLFALLGILGKYVSVLYAELKDRPIYIVKDLEK